MRISDWSSDVCSSDLAGQPDVGPAHRRDVREQRVGDDVATGPKMLSRPLEVHRVPVGDRRDHQVQARGPVLLVLPGPEIGRASCRAGVCTYGLSSVVVLPFKTQQHSKTKNKTI